MKILICLLLGVFYSAHALSSCYQCGYVHVFEGQETVHPNITREVYQLFGTDQNCLRMGPTYTGPTVPCSTHCITSMTTISVIFVDATLKFHYTARRCADSDNTDPKGVCTYHAGGSPHFHEKGRQILIDRGHDPSTLNINGTYCYCETDNCNTQMRLRPPVTAAAAFSSVNSLMTAAVFAIYKLCVMFQ